MRLDFSPRLSLSLLAVAALTVSIPALASADSFDILSFAAPAGWEKTVAPNDYVLYTGYNAKRTAYCQIVVFISRPSSGNPLRDFQEEWNEFVLKKYNVALSEKPEVIETGTGWTFVRAAAPVAVKNVTPFTSILTSIIGSGRVTTVMINVSDIKQFSDAIVGFTKSIAPINQSVASNPAVVAPAAGSAPAPSSSGPSASGSSPAAVGQAPAPGAAAVGLFGWWSGIGTTSTSSGVTNAAGTGYAAVFTGSRLKKSRIVFFPDGTFCGVIPQVGFDGLDVKAEMAKFPYYWGTYTFADGKGIVTINGSSYPFELKDNKVRYGNVEFNLHYLSPDGAHFAGTFTAEKDPGKYTGQEPTLTFTLDGRFTDNGAINWLRHVRGSTEDQSDKVTGSGTYLIRNYTMIFNYSDGRLIKLAFESIYGQDPQNPQQIVFSAWPLDRK